MQIANTPPISSILARFRREEPLPARDEELCTLIREAQKDIADCRRNLMFADSDELTDMYIYAIKAHEIRYAHLLQMAKKNVV
ncbi:MAG: DUF2508 family protein [Clostridia bacterium]|nr:DUF2508 family protein [Oscillospiraceae bacterium]MBQ7032733.1 DUF2508 family protein [Clostridia bacterium]